MAGFPGGFSERRRLRAGAMRGLAIVATGLVGLSAGGLFPIGGASDAQAAPAPKACPGDNGGIALPPGFCASVFADNLGHLRHLVVAPNGVVYANTLSGKYYRGGQPPSPDGYLLALRDGDGDGRAEEVRRFGEKVADNVQGGTGIRLYNGALYAEVNDREKNDRIVRYRLAPGAVVPDGKPETIVTGLGADGDHPVNAFIIDPKGQIFVGIGSRTDVCQVKNRGPSSPGADPCIEAQTRGGLFLYDANKVGQAHSAAQRYAAGIRNAEGMAFDAKGRLFVTDHGRDLLIQNWPALYPDPVRAAELPSETLSLVRKGGDYGWPSCYFDAFQNKRVLGPEYGGDGGKKVGACAEKDAPVAGYPGHYAPTSMVIYNQKAFPAAYQGGAFIAFHGSWNRAPQPQAGFFVAFQPLRDGKAAGPYITFADGFTGGKNGPEAAFRPFGLAIGPDGAMYIADDVKGRIWRVTYQGGPMKSPLPAQAAAVAPSAPALSPAAATAPRAAAPAAPAQKVDASLAAGARVYEQSGCAGCHGSEAKGTSIGPDLTSGTWIWGDGRLPAIREIIAKGVPEPKQYRGVMPAMGGAQLSPEQIDAVASYVWAASHKTQ